MLEIYFVKSQVAQSRRRDATRDTNTNVRKMCIIRFKLEQKEEEKTQKVKTKTLNEDAPSHASSSIVGHVLGRRAELGVGLDHLVDGLEEVLLGG